jgi:DNA invertase Pin-like site-specific DNA recombinase
MKYGYARVSTGDQTTEFRFSLSVMCQTTRAKNFRRDLSRCSGYARALSLRSAMVNTDIRPQKSACGAGGH